MATTARMTFPLREVDLILPVPLHWLKQRLKGYSPTEELAASVSRILQKPYTREALRRTRWTTTQTRLPWEARARNVWRAFAAKERWVVDRTILLIDDVMTSGATVQACSIALKEAGAHQVFVLTAARTPLPR